MRDPKRIKRILTLVESTWEKYPDLRLCQLIGNCISAGDNFYSIEDDDLEARLKEVYKK